MRYFLTAYFVFSMIWLTAQNNQFSFKGKIEDNQTHENLGEVQIINGKERIAVSDAYGNFEFNSDSVSLKLHFELFGYKSIIMFLDSGNDLLITMEAVENELNEVVVSANKSEQRVSNLSVSANLIKPLEIAKIHIVGSEELINRVQGVEIMDGQASIRGGSGFSYGAGSRVLTLVDGLPAVSADAGNVRWQFLPLENLEQIEVLKGASSVLYGSSALNGIINFRTAGADTIPLLKFSISAGLYDKPNEKNWVWWDSPRAYTDVSFSYSKRIKGTEIGAAGNILLDNGYRKLNDEKLGRLNFKIKQHSSKLSGLSYGANLNAGLNNKTDFILWEDADQGALKQNEETATKMHAYFFSFDPFISYNNGKRSKHDFRMRFQTAENLFPGSSQNNSNTISNYSEYQLYQNVARFLDLNLGISHNFSNIISNFYGDHKGNNLAAYTQLDFSFFSKLKINAGLRMEYFELDGSDKTVVPVFRAGLNYRLADYTFLRASFGQGYRYPSIAEKFAFTTLGAVKIYPNPEVKPEFGWTTEVGIKQGIGIGQLTGQLDFSFFYSKNTDMIEYVFGLYADPITQEIDFGFRASNIENSRVYGLETEFILSSQIGNVKTTCGGGYTYIYPVEFDAISNQNTETYLKYRRKHAGKFNLSATFKKFDTGFIFFLKSKILNIDDVFLDPLTRESLLPGFYDYWQTHNTGSFVADGYISYMFTKNMKISVVVKNFTNTEYMGRPGDIQPQRFYSLQLSGVF